MPFSSQKTQHFAAIYTLHIQGLKGKRSKKPGDETGKLSSARILFVVVSFLAYSLDTEHGGDMALRNIRLSLTYTILNLKRKSLS
jgi:hypothetical protein